MKKKDSIEELRHQLLNGLVVIKGCFKHIEAILNNMSKALSKYEKDVGEIDDD